METPRLTGDGDFICLRGKNNQLLKSLNQVSITFMKTAINPYCFCFKKVKKQSEFIVLKRQFGWLSKNKHSLDILRL